MFDRLVEAFNQTLDLNNFYQELTEYYWQYPLDDYLTDYLKFTKYLHDLGYVDLQLQILLKMYDHSQHHKIAYQLAKLYDEFNQAELALKWINLAKSSKFSYQKNLLHANILMNLGDYSLSKKILNKLIKSFPDRAEAYQSSAELAYLQNDIDRQIYFLEILYQYFSKYIDFQQLRTDLLGAYSQQEMLDLAKIKELVEDTDAPELTSQDYSLLAQIYLNIYAYEQSAQYAKRAIDLNPDDFSAHFILLEDYHFLRQDLEFEQSIDWLKHNLPVYSDLYLHLIELAGRFAYYDSQLADQVLEYYELSEEFDQREALIDYYVNYCLQAGQAQKALDFLKNIEDPYMHPVYLSYHYARIYQALGIESLVAAQYETALNNLLSKPNLALDYARFLKDQNKLEEALTVSERYERTYYDNKALRRLREELRRQHEQAEE
ncbi:tetratricopeptide repeat protein [Ignavigranum ruoffiae]|uniref:tetratricopeptide repeat protein n=1 Tax=Ignavigranum ruoffiae TaxID=89093 RepID=UPI002063B743|nr:tetratricopeptide repeat protein [Ignavigranum ruoffiae]UPQ85593.1 tetratricopeptide repeat protein [Ignavigranum ruoffiae]